MSPEKLFQFHSFVFFPCSARLKQHHIHTERTTQIQRGIFSWPHHYVQRNGLVTVINHDRITCLTESVIQQQHVQRQMRIRNMWYNTDTISVCLSCSPVFVSLFFSCCTFTINRRIFVVRINVDHLQIYSTLGLFIKTPKHTAPDTANYTWKHSAFHIT